MKLDALDHPKTLDFASRLDVTRPTAIGHLELLWAFTAKQAIQGNIGKWADGAIARACDWMGPADVFIAALVDSKLVDRDQAARLIVHDWADHAPSWVRAKLNKIGLSFTGSSGPSGGATREPTSEGSSDDSEADFSDDTSSDSSPSQCGLKSVLPARASPSLAMPSQEKSSQEGDARGRASPAAQPTTGKRKVSETARPPDDPVEGLDTQAWERWLDYRKQIRKPLKPVSIPAAQRELAAFGSNQAAVVQQSIAQGWQGLFALKTATRPAQPTTEFSRHREFGT